MKWIAAFFASLAIPAASPAAPAAELAPFAFLAGSCWRAAFPGGRITDTHCFTWVYGGHFLRDRHVVANLPEPYRGETLYRWDAATRAIRYDYYSSDGAHSGGLARSDGAAIRFTEAIDGGAHDNATMVRSSWTRADDGYVALAETPAGDGWRTLWQMHFIRVGPAPAD